MLFDYVGCDVVYAILHKFLRRIKVVANPAVDLDAETVAFVNALFIKRSIKNVNIKTVLLTF